MRSTYVVAGMLIAAGAELGLSLRQAETRVVDGVPRWVVPYVEVDVDRDVERVVDAPLAARCVRVGVPAAVLGAGIGYFASSGGLLCAALVGALAVGTLAGSCREAWPQNLGRAGENARVAESMLLGLMGALVGAAGVAKLEEHHERYPRRLVEPEPADGAL